MEKPHVIMDNNDGSIVAVFFQTEKALEYINFLSGKYGQMVDTDPETYRFVWEDLYDYSKKYIESQLTVVFPEPEIILDILVKEPN